MSHQPLESSEYNIPFSIKNNAPIRSLLTEQENFDLQNS